MRLKTAIENKKQQVTRMEENLITARLELDALNNKEEIPNVSLYKCIEKYCKISKIPIVTDDQHHGYTLSSNRGKQYDLIIEVYEAYYINENQEKLITEYVKNVYKNVRNISIER